MSGFNFRTITADATTATTAATATVAATATAISATAVSNVITFIFNNY